MINPFIHPGLYALYLGGLVLFSAAMVFWMVRTWNAERERVQRAIVEYLGLAFDDDGLGDACKQILTLVPSQGTDLESDLEALQGKGRLWLCFLAGRLLVIAGGTGETVELPYRDLKQLYLVHQGSGRPLVIATRGGQSTFSVGRLDDLVRIVNVLIKQNIVLRYMKKA